MDGESAPRVVWTLVDAPKPKPKAKPAATASAAAAPKAPRRSTVPALVLGSAGIISAYAGAFLVIGAESKYATARALAGQSDHQCRAGETKPAGLCRELRSTTMAVDLMGNLGIGALVLGGLLGGGAVATLVWPREQASGKAKAMVEVVPSVGASAAGAVIRGSF